MKIVLKCEELGALETKWTNDKLEQLESFSGDLGLKVRSLESVDGQDAAPGVTGSVVSGLLDGHGDEVGMLDMVLQLLKGRNKVRLCHL